MAKCSGVLSIRGEYWKCDIEEGHSGWACSNRDAEAIWAGPEVDKIMEDRKSD